MGGGRGGGVECGGRGVVYIVKYITVMPLAVCGVDISLLKQTQSCDN